MPKKKATGVTGAAKQTTTRPSRSGASAAMHAKRALPPKLTAPRAAKLFARERLFDLLDRVRRDHRVAWMSAPGGAGKTSLATSYLAARKLPVLWYQVDAGDGDVASFFYYLGLAVTRAAPRYKQPLPALTPEYLADLPTFTRNFFRELYRRLPAATVVVLDNYQDAPEASPLHDVVHIAMAEVPSDIHLMVLSRAEPPAVLARLRLCDHAACLDWSKLQLTPEESVGIGVARLGKNVLSEDTLTTLHQRTHGWAAGLVLMLEQASSGERDAKDSLSDQKLMFDYFTGEILNRSEPTVRAFLLKTALLPKISVADARVLTGVDNAEAILEDLTRRNFFTVRHAGTSGDTYEYHPLFREFLRSRARATFDPAAFDALHREAGRLLAQSGAPEDAALLFQQGRNWSELAALICTQAPAYIAQGRYHTVQTWIAPLPEPLCEQEPWILLWHGAAWQPFDLPRARVLYERAYARFKATDDMPGLWLSWSGIVETFIFEWARFAPLDHWIAEFYALMAQDKTPPTPELMGRAVIGIFTALMYRQPGHADLPKWVAQLEAMLHQGLEPVAMTMIGMQLLTYYSFWTGDMARARALYTHVAPVAGRSGLPPLAAIAWQVSQAIHGWMTAENDRCVAAARRGLEIARDSGVHLFDVMLRMQEMSGLATAGRMEEAARALDQARSALIPSRLLDASYFLLMQAAISFGGEGARQARINSEQCLYLAREAGCPWAIGQALGWLVWASVRVGDIPAAEKYLREAKVIVQASASELTAFVIQYEEWYMHSTKNEPQQTLTALRETWVLARKLGIMNWLSWPYPETAQFCAQALAHDIEPDYVRALIKKRGLLPPANEVVPDLWPWSVRIHTLGAFRVLGEEGAAPRLQRKPLELLKAVIALGARDVSFGALQQAVWPDGEGDVRALLDTNLYRLRKALGESVVVIKDGRVTLDRDHCWVDVWAFEQSAAALDSTPADPAVLASATESLLRLYRGPFLGQDPDAVWAIGPRERLRSKFLRCLAVLAAHHEQARRYPEAIACAQRALEADALAESCYRVLMRCHLAQGRRAEALSVYRNCRDVLHTALGLAPAPETEALRRQAEGPGTQSSITPS